LRVQLAGFYVQVLTTKEKPPPGLVRKNFLALIRIKLFGARRALALLRQAASSRHLSDRGVTRALIDFNLGALSAMKKRRDEARSYFEKARAAAEIRARTSSCKKSTPRWRSSDRRRSVSTPIASRFGRGGAEVRGRNLRPRVRFRQSHAT
jgi:hypothetical protein